MSFADYDAFKAAFLSWADNPDVDQQADNIIALVHARLNRQLRLEEMTKLAYANTVGGDPWLPKPDGYMGMRRMKTTHDQGHGLDYVNLGEMDDRYPTHILGQPEVYTVLGDRFRFGPVPEGEYEVEIAFYERVPTLTAANPTNTFLTAVSDLLLFACLVESEDWVKEDPRLPRWKSRYAECLAEVTEDVEDEAFPAGQLSMSAV